MSREERADKLKDLIEPLVENLGYELVKLNYAARKHGLLHLIIDQEKGIKVEDCELVSRAVSELLDREDPISHAYTLEVSSPGLERPLTKAEHFIRFAGNKVKIRTKAEVKGQSKFAGNLLGWKDNHVIFESEAGDRFEIPEDMILKANLWYVKPAKKGLNK